MNRALEIFKTCGIAFTDKELATIDYADFGLNNYDEEGLNIIVYENNQDYCAKEMVLLPHQTCPEHLHPNLKSKSGKKETFRCREGEVYLYVEGVATEQIKAIVPSQNAKYYTARHEIILKPGEQYTIKPNTKHWFQAGSSYAVISEFSTQSLDQFDLFTNPEIKGH